mmetsp:Transcript_54557/g.95362  ORF Transcript_54557/g.95362 Transcript_54557/m.95362 type:complete len:281 (-) Transcript_54557:2669-3511(-)
MAATAGTVARARSHVQQKRAAQQIRRGGVGWVDAGGGGGHRARGRAAARTVSAIVRAALKALRGGLWTQQEGRVDAETVAAGEIQAAGAVLWGETGTGVRVVLVVRVLIFHAVFADGGDTLHAQLLHRRSEAGRAGRHGGDFGWCHRGHTGRVGVDEVILVEVLTLSLQSLSLSLALPILSQQALVIQALEVVALGALVGEHTGQRDALQHDLRCQQCLLLAVRALACHHSTPNEGVGSRGTRGRGIHPEGGIAAEEAALAVRGAHRGQRRHVAVCATTR